MYRELTISSDVPASKLTKAFKTGKLSLTADQLKGSGFVVHLHPASYEIAISSHGQASDMDGVADIHAQTTHLAMSCATQTGRISPAVSAAVPWVVARDSRALKAHKSGRGVRLDITRHEVKKGYKRAQGGSVWSKIWGGIKSAFKVAKHSVLLTQAANAAVPAIATALGAPQVAIPARAAIRSMTGIGVYDSDSDVDKEGGRVSVADVKKAAKSALGYAKRKGVLTDAVDAGERYLLCKATKPEHEHLVKSLRGEVRRRYGVGVAKKGRKFAKGSQRQRIIWQSSEP